MELTNNQHTLRQLNTALQDKMEDLSSTQRQLVATQEEVKL